MRNTVISGETRLLAAVSELDASPAPATEMAAERLVAVVGALVPGEVSKVHLGDHGVSWFSAQHPITGRPIADLPMWSPGARDQEHLLVTVHDSTGLLTTGRRKDIGSVRSPRSTIDYGHHGARLVLTPAARAFWLPFGIENMLRAPLDFPNERAHLASYRVGSDFSEGDIRLLDQLRPVASRLLRRAALSSLAEASASAWGLAPREAEVFAFVGLGLSVPSVASLLGLSVGTVRTQLGRAYGKAGVRSRAAATSALLDVEPTALREAGHRLVPAEGGPLTPREIEVLRIAATGRTTSAIASSAGISMETAKTHLANVYRKLGVRNRSQALLLMRTTTGSVGGSGRPAERTGSPRERAATIPA